MNGKKEGKQPCRDAPPTNTGNDNDSSFPAPTESSAGPPRDRRHLEEARKKRKEEDDAREQERIKRQQRHESGSAGAGAEESSKEQDDLQLAIEQSLAESGMQQLHLRGSPGPSTRRAPMANDSIQDAKDRGHMEQAKRQSREAYAREQSRAGEPPVKEQRTQQSGSQLTQPPAAKQATANPPQKSVATTKQSAMPPTQGTVRKPAPLTTIREEPRASPQATIQPLNTQDQQHLDRIRDRLNNRAQQAPLPSVSTTARDTDEAQLTLQQAPLPPRNQRLPEVRADRVAEPRPQAAPPASTQNLRATQEQLASYQREQRELQERRQQAQQGSVRQTPSSSSVRSNSITDASRLSTRPPTSTRSSRIDTPVRQTAPQRQSTSSRPPADTIAKPKAAITSANAVAKPPAPVTRAPEATVKAQPASNKRQTAIASSAQASSSKTPAAPSNAQTASSGRRSLLPSSNGPVAGGLQANAPASQTLPVRAPTAPGPRTAAPRTAIGGNVSQALTQLLVPDAANNANQQRPAGTRSLGAAVAETPRAPEVLPAVASQRITAQIQGTGVYPGIDAGGATRRAAESRGPAAVREFESVLRRGLLALCPAGYQWYNTDGGYICGGGHHFVLHASIDIWANNFMLFPGMHGAHAIDVLSPLHTLTVHPPPVNPMEPIHFYHRNFMMQCAMRGVIVDNADICPCIREMGFAVRSTAEVEALEYTTATIRKVFNGTGLLFWV